MRVRIVLASPSDVLPERKLVALVIERLNRHFADQHTQLMLHEWETSASPGFNRKGRQNRIDTALKIEASDLFIGIMWKKFGTPVHDAGSGTAHEFNVAYGAFLKSDNDKPQIFFYFKKVIESELTKKELAEYRKVKRFREKFPQEGLWWMFETEAEFERQLYDHIKDHVTFLLREQPTLAPQPISTPETTEASNSLVSDTDSQPLDHEEVLNKSAAQGIHRMFNPRFAIPWRTSFAVTLLLVTVFSLYRFWKSSAPLESQLAEVIQKDVQAGLTSVTLYPHLNVRGGPLDDKLTTVSPTSGPVRVELKVLLQSKDSTPYDVTLFDESTDVELLKITSLPIRDQAIYFTFNPGVLREGRYRFMLSHDNAVMGFYSFVIGR